MAIDFEANSNQNVNLGTSGLTALQNVAGCTLMAWVRVESWANAEGMIMHWSTGTGLTSVTRAGFSSRADSNTKFRTTSRRLDADSAVFLDTTTTNYSTATWYHVAVVENWTNQVQRIFVNGVQNNSQAVAGWTGNSSNTPSQAARIGIRADASTTSDFDGIIADARVYNRVLSANEIMSIYTARGGDGNLLGLVHRHNMNEGYAGQTASGASTVIDRGYGNIKGTPTNSPVYTAAPGIMPRRRAA